MIFYQRPFYLMKVTKIVLAFLLICVSAFASDISTDVALEYKTRRISKGKVSNPDPIALIDLKTSFHGFYVGLFGIEDLTEYNKSKGIDRYEFERFEWKVGYAYKFTDLALINSLKTDVGYIYTDFQEDMIKNKKGETKHEIYLKLTTGLPFNPGIKINYDTQNEYIYVNPYASYDFVITENLTFKNELNLYFYNRKMMLQEWKINDGAFTCFYYKCFLKYKLNKNISFGPLFEAAYALDNRVKDAWEQSDKNSNVNFLFGLKLDMKF